MSMLSGPRHLEIMSVPINPYVNPPPGPIYHVAGPSVVASGVAGSDLPGCNQFPVNSMIRVDVKKQLEIQFQHRDAECVTPRGLPIHTALLSSRYYLAPRPALKKAYVGMPDRPTKKPKTTRMKIVKYRLQDETIARVVPNSRKMPRSDDSEHHKAPPGGDSAGAISVEVGEGESSSGCITDVERPFSPLPVPTPSPSPEPSRHINPASSGKGPSKDNDFDPAALDAVLASLPEGPSRAMWCPHLMQEMKLQWKLEQGQVDPDECCHMQKASNAHPGGNLPSNRTSNGCGKGLPNGQMSAEI